jgi:hypothetical protein
MKKLILFTNLILLPLFVFAQPELTGPLGLTFGMNKALVKKIMIDKGGVLVATGFDNTFTFTGITMGSVPSVAVVCMFINRKLYRIFVLFSTPSKGDIQFLFDKIESIVESKYGKPKSTRDFISPYMDVKGDEASALIAGKAIIISSWDQFKNNSRIDLEILATNSDVSVYLYYTDGVLSKDVNAKNAIEF